MNSDPTSKLLEDFVKVAKLAGVAIPFSEIQVEQLLAPHSRPSSLPVGKLAVYVFMYGERCLKVGKAGAKSTARYCSQHYGLHAPSTLAKSLIKSQSRLSLTGLDESNIGNWICQNTNRINVLLPSKYGVALLSLLESFIQCRLNPEFEGFESQKTPTKGNFNPAGHSRITVGSLFDPEPGSWGLRGDPFLWRQIRRKLFATPLPATEAAFDSLIASEFLELSGKLLSTKNDFHVEEYAHGGMSSGYISPEFWREQAMPLLRQRYAAAQHGAPADRRKTRAGR